MSDEITVEHLDMMAADLHERAAKLFREGRRDHAGIVGKIAAELHRTTWRPDSAYIRALGFAVAGTGSTVRLRDHFEAIQRGEWPADSLAGRVEKMRTNANEAMSSSDDRDYLTGRVHATIDVLDLLGVKP